MNKILKICVVILLIVIALGCGRKEEQAKDEMKRIEYIIVEGICGEDHTNVKGKYSGSIDHLHNITKDIHYRYGHVSHRRSVDERIDEGRYSVENQYKYFLPYMIKFRKLKPEDLVGDELHLKGVSESTDFSERYEATCVLKVIKRLDYLPSSEEKDEWEKQRKEAE